MSASSPAAAALAPPPEVPPLFRQEFIIHAVAFFLDPPSLVNLSRCNAAAHQNILGEQTLRWISDTQGLTHEGEGLRSLELFQLVKTINEAQSSVSFEWGVVELSPSSMPTLKSLAELLQRHPAAAVSVEGQACAQRV